MLRITPPPHYSESEADSKIECAVVIDGKEEMLWYATTKEYGKYLTTERVDPFLLGVLQFAMKEGHDIEVDAPVSEKLYFNLVELVVPLLSKAFGHKQINIQCLSLDNSILNVGGDEPWAVGTGCSLGVDSFGTILKYTQDSIPEHYRVNCLTYFNVGAHGNDINKATASYEHDLPMIEEYATFKKMPLVKLSSNIGKLYQGWNFGQCHHTRNIASVLTLQKLFARYFYASGHPVSEIHLSQKDAVYYEAALIPYLSTENTEILIGQPDNKRIDKEEFISKFPETYNRLYVCWREILKNNYDTDLTRDGQPKLNCSHCEKCRRTMLALFLFGKEQEYSNIFDWSYFHAKLDKIVGYALANRKRNPSYEDLVRLMNEKDFRPTFRAKLYGLGASFIYSIPSNKLRGLLAIK